MSNAESVRSTVYLAPELHQALRLKAAHSRRSMSDIVNDAVRQALREDQEDLSAVRSRSREKTISYEDFLGKLKADGTL
jgi:plasmid stability protein